MAKLIQSQRARNPVPSSIARQAATHRPATTAVRPPAPAPPRRAAGIRVEAIQVGYFDHSRRRIGDVFDIHTEQEFSSKWMRKVGTGTPLSETLPNEAIRREHDAILGGKRPAILTGPDDVADDLPRGTRNPLGD